MNCKEIEVEEFKPKMVTKKNKNIFKISNKKYNK
jgi:hypothetical protein